MLLLDCTGPRTWNSRTSRTSTIIWSTITSCTAGVLVYLIIKRAGHVFGLDGLLERMHMVEQYPVLRPLVG